MIKKLDVVGIVQCTPTSFVLDTSSAIIRQSPSLLILQLTDLNKLGLCKTCFTDYCTGGV